MVCGDERDKTSCDATRTRSTSCKASKGRDQLCDALIVIALLYFSFTEPIRIQKKMVEAIIDASVKLSEL